MNLLTSAEMREVERAADSAGLSYATMMRNAGGAVADEILNRLAPGDSPAQVLILCGSGNNGGDGLVCAAALVERALREKRALMVRAYLLRARAPDDPLIPPLAAAQIGVLAQPDDEGLRTLRVWLANADVIVDALLGTGATRTIEGPLRDLLHEVQVARDRSVKARRPGVLRGLPAGPAMVAVDGPSGMGYETGSLDPNAVSADLTVTFHAAKRGHFCYPAAGARGELVVAPIGIEGLTPTDGRLWTALNPPARISVVDDAWVRERLPRRVTDANKGSHGRALIVAGSHDYPGAPALCAGAAYRAGAGLVTLAVPEAGRSVAAALIPEAVYVPQTVSGLEKLSGISAALVGPGLGRGDSGRAALGAFMAAMVHLRADVRGVVFDADALNMLAEDEALLEYRLSDLSAVLTPHPGEMARLTSLPVAEIQADRIGHASRLARDCGAVVVLKGANTVIASRDGQVMLINSANAALATAGTGDVLAGAIDGLMAQGLRPFDAAVCGAALHARAGELWRDAHGDSGLLASDLLPLLPAARMAIMLAP
jgi:NAD(P)H-hydrate epimerase